MMKKRKAFLQIAVACGGLVPVAAGLSGILLGPNIVDHAAMSAINLDSHFRYLSGLLLGIGICFWTTIPNIERKTTIFQLLTVIVFIGGLGRLYALILMGVPDRSMLFGLAMELVATPLLAVAQRNIAKTYIQ